MAIVVERIIGQEIVLEIVDEEPLPLPTDRETPSSRTPRPSPQKGPLIDDLVPDHSGTQDLW